ncbi:MAG TPA: hypothetical protein PLI21_01160, partial [Methanomassiliicoccaceae archaeon]|nr:hypothetical protein [Methanomassiliicoccaceae archaeon]
AEIDNTSVTKAVVTALEETSAKERSKKGTLIIPGMLSRMSGKLQELSGLKVVVGPRESSGIPKLLKSGQISGRVERSRPFRIAADGSAYIFLLFLSSSCPPEDVMSDMFGREM